MTVDRLLPTDEARDLIALTRDVADKVLAPIADAHEKSETYPEGVAVFGGKFKVSVLKLRVTFELDFLRRFTELLLRENFIPWSAEWAFSPHVTLGGADAQLVGEPPAVLRFNCMEWRP